MTFVMKPPRIPAFGNAPGDHLIQRRFPPAMPWNPWLLAQTEVVVGESRRAGCANAGLCVNAESLCVNAESCNASGRLCGVACAAIGASGHMRHLARGEWAPTGDVRHLLVNSVHSGLVALCAGLADGRRQIVALASAGDSLSACSELMRECWIEALAPSVLCVVDLAADDAARMRRENGLLNAVLKAAHERLETTLARLITLGGLDGSERVAAFLAELTHRLGARVGDGWQVELTLTRQDIADYLGLKPETVSRILGKLRRDGILRVNARARLDIPDLAALEARFPALRRASQQPAAAPVRPAPPPQPPSMVSAA
jgi:CRP/FNR family transcriptional regulator